MTTRRLSRYLPPILAAGLLAACGHGETGGSPDPTVTDLAPTLASIQDNVFTPTCAISGCHGSSGTQAGLRLDPGFSYGSLINVVSPTYGLARVAPGDPDNSLLIQKLEGAPSVGQRMPAFGIPLSQETIDVIRQWILNGAPES